MTQMWLISYLVWFSIQNWYEWSWVDKIWRFSYIIQKHFNYIFKIYRRQMSEIRYIKKIFALSFLWKDATTRTSHNSNHLLAKLYNFETKKKPTVIIIVHFTLIIFLKSLSSRKSYYQSWRIDIYIFWGDFSRSGLFSTA